MWRLCFVSLIFVLIAPTGIAESYVFEGQVSRADGAFLALTPVETTVRALVTVADTAVINGTAMSNDIDQVLVSFGDFCFHFQFDCVDGVDIPIWSFIDTAMTIDQGGTISGGYLKASVSSPTFGVPILVIFDFTADTLTTGYPALGFATAGGQYFASVLGDVDDDGFVGEFDNCTMASNPDQLDSNFDGFGNACDPDINNDCVINFWDSSLFSQFFGLNIYDADFDGELGVTFSDYAILISYFGLPPGPSGYASCP